MPRWRIDLEYDGAPFVGWQVQPNGPSVQQHVEGGLERLLGQAVRITGSGRTDAGVHAEQQVASFWTEVQRSPRSMMLGLNANLPDSISCTYAEQVSDDFDARRWVLRKRYRYQWFDRRARPVRDRDRFWHHQYRLDAHAMMVAGQALVGVHDFTSFRAAGCTALHPVRHIEALWVERHGDRIELHVQGHGFLRHMVRIIAGTLTEVGRGRKPVRWVEDVLSARDRTKAGRTAPAWGLTLASVEYGSAPPERTAELNLQG